MDNPTTKFPDLLPRKHNNELPQKEAPYTEADLKKLRAIYASGILKTKLGDREVWFQSEDALKKTIDRIESELGKRRTVTFSPTFSKGL